MRTLQKEDRLDSFVLAETFKYLYLLFADESDLILDLNNWLFTTEGHLMPLSLARLSNRTAVPVKKNRIHYLALHFHAHHSQISVLQLKPGAGQDDVFDEDVDFARACPSPEYLFPTRSREYAGDVRAPLANHVAQKCPVKRLAKRSLLAADFNSGNADHLEYIKVVISSGSLHVVSRSCEAFPTSFSAWASPSCNCPTVASRWCSTPARPRRRPTCGGHSNGVQWHITNILLS